MAALEKRISELECQLAAVREALERLCDKLDAVTEASASVFVMAKIHGMRYRGPDYSQELTAARAALSPDSIGECLHQLRLLSLNLAIRGLASDYGPHPFSEQLLALLADPPKEKA